jgi:hypothetical protein
MNSREASVIVATSMLAAAIASGEAIASPCSGRSAADRAVLVELFTSEGCDSCPPADRWLSRLRQDAAGGRLVPLAFHVDYWDYLGWQDPYAHAAHGQRQREAAARNRLRTVYTPQVVVGGRDMPQWREAAAFSEAVAKSRKAPARAEISLSWQASARTAQLDVSAQLHRAAEFSEAAAYVALYENRLISRVQAGENRGATLEHDFVVRGLIGPLAFGQDGRLQHSNSLALRSEWKVQDLGVAAFVQARGSGEVLQALAVQGCGP